MQIKVTDGKNAREYAFREGTSAAEAISALGFDFPMPCGGKGRCGKCRCKVNGREALACKTPLFSDAVIEIPLSAEYVLTAHKKVEDVRGVAIDIGTTTIAAAAFEKGVPVKTAGCRNPQCAWGADVISRIGREDTAPLTKAVQSKIREIRLKLGKDLPTVITGNTAMLSLLTGLNTAKMGVYPFEAPSKFDCEFEGAYLPPCAGAFIGADALCSLLRSGGAEKDETSLMLDLGTNGEIALVHNGEITFTSAAAGPALEGGGISCGMSASEGAVYRIREGIAETVGGGPAKGICGSGLIDAAALMLKNGFMDGSGRIEKPYTVCPGVTITQSDIRQFQLCKGALSAAVKFLLSISGTDIDNVERIYLSGALGESINVENAVLTGLLPKSPVEKFTAIGNGALLGGAMLLKEKNRKKLRRLAAKARVVNPAGDPGFSDLYISEMNFY